MTIPFREGIELVQASVIDELQYRCRNERFRYAGDAKGLRKCPRRAGRKIRVPGYETVFTTTWYRNADGNTREVMRASDLYNRSIELLRRGAREQLN